MPKESIINPHHAFKGTYSQITFMKTFMQSSPFHNFSYNIFKVNDLNKNAILSSCVQSLWEIVFMETKLTCN
jgi:hypothetical protein